MKNLLLILKYSKKTYTHLVFDSFVTWCDIHSLNAKDLQILVTNQQLYNWFMHTYNSLEVEFYNHINTPDTYKLSLDDIRTIYDNTTIRVGIYYPANLLKSIRKTHPIKVKSKTIFNNN